MKFSEMKYERIEFEQVKADMKKNTNEIASVSNAAGALKIFKDVQKICFDVNTMSSISRVRHTIDTSDKFYNEENDFYDEIEPVFNLLYQDFCRELLKLPYREELEAEIGSLIFTNIEILLKTMSPEIVQDVQEENKLISEYAKLLASTKVDYDGKQYTFAQFGVFKVSDDSKVRAAAWKADGLTSLSIGGELNRIYSELVLLRNKIAKKLGYKNYVELGYYRMNRNCYGQEDVKKFREEVIKYIVPIATRLKKEQAQRLGVESLNMADASNLFLSGNAKPKGTPEEIFEAGKKMYHQLSPITGEFIDFMLENELFDVLSRDNKAGGGYCTYFPNYRAPFIFANFNGTEHDIQVLTHEAGHALCCYMARDIDISDYIFPTMESAEVHSMSMEMFTRPWAELFFKEDTKKFLYAHLAGAIDFIPYGVIVDEFQHIIYENPDWKPEQWHEAYKELEKKYRPWLNIEGIPFYEDGRRWQRQAHIYQSPFYYIDYCLAQSIALKFWAADLKDHASAWERYIKFIGFAGTKTFKDLLAQANISSPFEEDALKEVAQTAIDWLDDQDVSALK